MKEQFWLKPAAIILGILAWMYVNVFSSAPIVREYKAKISYLNIDTTKDYKIIPESPEVKVCVKGPRGVFIQTKVEENTFASVDLLNSHSGKLTLPVNVILPANSNLTLVSKEPAQLVLNSVLLAKKNIPVKVNTVGNVPEGFLSSEPITSPKTLEVTAPAEILDTIKECRIDVYLDSIKRSISEYRQTHIVYNDDKVETNLKDALINIANNNVKLDILVREGYPEKLVSVKPNLINKTPEGRKLEQTIALPEKIKITGPERLLNSIDEVKLETIDLAKVLKSSTLNVKAVCPNGINVVGMNSVALTIKYTDVPISRTISGIPLEISCDEDQLVECGISSYSMLIEGLVDDINSLNVRDLKKVINAHGVSSGTHYMPVDIPSTLSDAIKVKSIEPSVIPVTINIMEKVESKEQEKVDVSILAPLKIDASSTAELESSKQATETDQKEADLNDLPPANK